MLVGHTVYLRPLKEEDTASIFSGLQDEEALYMTATRKIFTKEEVIAAVRRFEQDTTRHDFAICLVESGVIIGDLAITEIDLDNNKAMYRIAMHHKKHYGNGYGTEATLLAQQFVFEQLQLNRLELQVYSHNPRAIAAYKKAGFRKEGVLRQTLYMNNVYSDEIIMSVLYEDYMRK